MAGRLAVLLLVLVLGAERAGASEPKDCFRFTEFDFGNVTHVMMEKLAPGARSWPCFDEECRARQDLACVSNAMAHRLQPDTMGYNRRADADRDWDSYGRVFRAFGRTHPRRIPLYCSLLAEVAGRVTGKEEELDRTVGNVLDLALKLQRPGNKCFERARAAFPAIPSVQEKVKMSTCTFLPDFRACQRSLDLSYR